MPGGWTMSMMWMPMPGQGWLASAARFLLMWLAMMIAMMLPSAMPMLQRYRRSLPETARGDLWTLVVACGYFIVWLAFGVVVYGGGLLLAAAAMRSAPLSRAVPLLSGAGLVIAGILQLSRWKMVGLMHCRDPHECSAEGTHGWRSSWTHGIHQGLYCGLCCAGLMLMLVAVGTMNLLAMLAVGVVITAEKLLSKPQAVVRATGILVVIAGLFLMIRSFG